MCFKVGDDIVSIRGYRFMMAPFCYRVIDTIKNTTEVNATLVVFYLKCKTNFINLHVNM